MLKRSGLDDDLLGRKTMKLQRLLIALTIFNLGLLVFLLAQIEVRFLGFRFAAMHERDLLYARE
jgi:hypothetical protein